MKGSWTDSCIYTPLTTVFSSFSVIIIETWISKRLRATINKFWYKLKWVKQFFWKLKIKICQNVVSKVVNLKCWNCHAFLDTTPPPPPHTPYGIMYTIIFSSSTYNMYTTNNLSSQTEISCPIQNYTIAVEYSMYVLCVDHIYLRIQIVLSISSSLIQSTPHMLIRLEGPQCVG